MYDEPEEDRPQPEQPSDPRQRAKEKADEFRMHAELAAVFEGPRKFDAALRTGMDGDLARDVQRTIAKLEKSKSPDSPVLPEPSMAEAARLLRLPQDQEFPTGDYHVRRRPGEVMIVRWLAGDEVDTFYERMQAHFDAALEGYVEDERQARGWKDDPQTNAFLDALEGMKIRMDERYLRDFLRLHRLFVL